MNEEQIRARIEAGMSTEHVAVTGDGRHFEATVVSGEFEGKRSIAQHRLVYAAIGEAVGRDELHALALKTFTPAQWREQRREQGGA